MQKEEEENNNPVNNVTGCMDSIAANFNPSVVEDDGSCDYRVTGGNGFKFQNHMICNNCLAR